LEQYVAQYPQLGPLAELSTVLSAAEYRARRHWGDRPQRPEYARRFPQRQGLDAILDEIDRREPVEDAKPFSPGKAAQDPASSLSVAEFIERLSTSRLLSGTELTTFQERLPADQRPQDAQGLTRRPVAAGKLTEYQLQASAAESSRRSQPPTRASSRRPPSTTGSRCSRPHLTPA